MKKIISLFLIGSCLQATKFEGTKSPEPKRMRFLEAYYYDDDEKNGESSSSVALSEAIDGSEKKQITKINYPPFNFNNLPFADYLKGYKKVIAHRAQSILAKKYCHRTHQENNTVREYRKHITRKFDAIQNKKNSITWEGLSYLEKYFPEHILNRIASYVIASTDKSKLIWLQRSNVIGPHATNQYEIQQDQETSTTTIACKIIGGCAIPRMLNNAEPYCTRKHKLSNLDSLWNHISTINQKNLTVDGDISYLFQTDPNTVITAQSNRMIYSWNITEWNKLHEKIISKPWTLYQAMALIGHLKSENVDKKFNIDPNTDYAKIIHALENEVRAPTIVYETDDTDDEAIPPTP